MWEEFIRELKEEGYFEDVDELDIEEALFDISQIINLSECIRKYLDWKDRLNFNELEKARTALSLITVGNPLVREHDKTPFEKLGLIMLFDSFIEINFYRCFSFFIHINGC